MAAVAENVAAGADAQPSKVDSAPASAEPVSESLQGGAEEQQRSLGAAAAAAERAMRHCVSCAIIDLKFDIWEHIEPFLHNTALDLEAGGESDPDADDESGNGHQRPGVKLGADAGAGCRLCQPQSDGDEEVEENELWKEFTENYFKASGYDDRMKEVDAIEAAYYNTDMDKETRMATMRGLWRHIHKELSDRARAVTTGAFKF